MADADGDLHGRSRPRRRRADKRVFVAGNIGACISKTKAVYAKTSPITPTDLADIDDVCNYVFQGNGEVNVEACDDQLRLRRKRVICDKTFCATQVTRTSPRPAATRATSAPTGNYCAQRRAQRLVCTAKWDSGTTCDATSALPGDPALRGRNLHRPRRARPVACTSNDDCVTAAPYCDPYASDKCALGLFVRGRTRRRAPTSAAPAAPAPAAPRAAAAVVARRQRRRDGRRRRAAARAAAPAARRRRRYRRQRRRRRRRRRRGTGGGGAAAPAAAVAAPTRASKPTSKAAGRPCRPKPPHQPPNRDPAGLSARACSMSAAGPALGVGARCSPSLLCLPRLVALRFLGPLGAEAGRAGARHRALGQPVRRDGGREVPRRPRAGDVAVRARDPPLRRERAGRAAADRAVGGGGADGGLLGGARPAAPARRAAGDAGAGNDAALRAGGAPAHVGRAADRDAGAGAGRARPFRLAAGWAPARARSRDRARAAWRSGSTRAARCSASCCPCSRSSRR